jgi:hypothetical protein
VASGFADNLLTMLGVHANGNLITHGAGGDQQRCLAAKNLRRPVFQTIDRGIFPINVIAYFGRGHGSSHGGRGTGDGIAAQVD